MTTLIAKSPSWSEDFSAPPSPQYWDRGFSAWPNTVNNRILWASGEVEVYIDKTNFGHDELSWRQGHVIFTAERMNSAERADIDTRILREHINGKAANALRRASWVSSLLKGRRAFLYGYFEARLRWDGSKSAWPAFWLLPQHAAWPPEIDILEIPGDATAHQTLHSMPGDPTPHLTVKTPIDDKFHSYGVLWGPKAIIFFIDRVATARFATPPDMHQPMYPLLNLAVGGWARPPDTRTPAKMTMAVEYVRWWNLDDIR